jgi:hypothetical protein
VVTLPTLPAHQTLQSLPALASLQKPAKSSLLLPLLQILQKLLNLPLNNLIHRVRLQSSSSPPHLHQHLKTQLLNPPQQHQQCLPPHLLPATPPLPALALAPLALIFPMRRSRTQCPLVAAARDNRARANRSRQFFPSRQWHISICPIDKHLRCNDAQRLSYRYWDWMSQRRQRPNSRFLFTLHRLHTL